MDSATLELYLTRYGWTFERYDEALVSGVSTAAGNILIAFQLGAPWLRLSAPAYAPGHDRPASFYAQLLRLNDRARLVRFALDENDQVFPCVDLYVEPAPSFEQFALALDILTYVAETSLPHLIGDEYASTREEMGENPTEAKP